MKNEVITAEKRYNTQIKMWERVTKSGQVLITCKTERGLDSNWKKYLTSWV